MTYFKDKVYLYGSEAITYLNDILSVGTEPAPWVNCPPPPLQPPSTHLHPSLYGSITFTYLEENSSMAKVPYRF